MLLLANIDTYIREIELEVGTSYRIEAHESGTENFLEQEIEDNYGILIEKLWIRLGVEDQKCACYVCAYKHPFCWDRSCDKIIRQRFNWFYGVEFL